MSHIAYYRVSTTGQSIEAQKSALTHAKLIEREFMDEGVSGSIPAANRPGFAAMIGYVREGDTIHVYAVDRLGRDAIDVQTTIRALLKKGVTVEVNGLGSIGPGVGELIVAVLAQVADMERARISERTANGRTLAKASLAATGLTHRGKESLGRPAKADGAAVKAWRSKTRHPLAQPPPTSACQIARSNATALPNRNNPSKPLGSPSRYTQIRAKDLHRT